MLSSWLLGLLAGYLFLKEGTLLLRQVRYRGLECPRINKSLGLTAWPTKGMSRVLHCLGLAVLCYLKPYRATPALENKPGVVFFAEYMYSGLATVFSTIFVSSVGNGTHQQGGL